MKTSGPASPLTVAVPGDILSTTAEGLQGLLQPAIAAVTGGAVLELDLRATRMVDSVGLNLLVTVIKRTKAAGGSVRLRVSPGNVHRIIQFSRLHQHAEVVTQ